MLRSLPVFARWCVTACLFLAASGCGRTPLRLTVGDAGTDAQTDGTVGQCTTDADCADALVCNGAERCVLGQCLAGAPLDCDDHVDCTVDRCLEAAAGCEHMPDPTRCAPGQLCDPTQGCLSKTCTTNADCDDGLICDGQETCVSGLCAPGTVMACADTVACTNDVCSEAASGCLFVTDDSKCADGLFCNGAEVCDPTLGCQPAILPACTVGNACMISACDEATDTCSVTTADTDGDGAADGACGGPDCNDLDPNVFPGNAETCTNVVDDDCDGLVDCADADCASMPVCQCTPVPEVCNNQSDDDCDMLVDCADPSCVTSPACIVCAPAENCTNVVDDDCNGLADCADPACASQPSCCMPTAEICNNNKDDDCDGQVDCADASCTGQAVCCVPTAEVCNNNKDDDCDMLVDCADSSCATSPSCCTPSGAETSNIRCADLVDDDCDGLIDCNDPGCANTQRCMNCLPSELCVSPFNLDLDCDLIPRCSDPDCPPPFPFCIGG